MRSDFMRFIRRCFDFLVMLGIFGLSSMIGIATAAPTITATTPATGATNVQKAATVSATFSEAMDPASITSGSFTLSRFVGIKAITSGHWHNVVVKNDGTVTAWGYNGTDMSIYGGQTSVPAGLTGVTAVAAGDYHSAALKSDGTVVAWGVNSKVQVPAGLSGVTAIAAGAGHTLALKDDGTVVGWGSNGAGQTTPPAGLAGVIAVAGGFLHSLALKNDGTVAAWGFNTSSQCNVPSGLSGVTAIAGGTSHSVALKNDGTVVAWGSNSYGQTTVPASLTGVIAIAAGRNFTIALKNDGTVVAWGKISDNEDTLVPVTVPAGLSGVTAIAAGGDHVLALKNDGTLVVWGNNAKGQATVPADLYGVASITGGMLHSVALRNDGTVISWGTGAAVTAASGASGVKAVSAGYNHTGVLKNDGTVTTFGYLDFSGAVTVPLGLSGVTAIASGGDHILALKSDGSVVGWGTNGNGESSVPGSLTNVIAIAAGTYHSVALKSNGTVAAWPVGYSASTVPTGLGGVTAIAAGEGHTVALTSLGTVVVWGGNTYGQTNIPAGLSGVIAIAAKGAHTLALKNDGTVAAWGSFGFGESIVPSGLSGVVAIGAGRDSSYAIKKDGTVVTWGREVGQLSIPESPYTTKIPGTVDYNAAGNTATLTPAAPLLSSAHLTATINTGVSSLLGDRPAADYSWSFTIWSSGFSATPNPVDTGSVDVGSSSAPLPVTLQNNGTTAIIVSGATIIGADAGMFSLSPGTCGTLTPTLAAQSSCTLELAFSPTSGGSKNAVLQITSNDQANSTLNVPIYAKGVSLTNPLTLIFAGSGSGSVTFSIGDSCTGNCSQSLPANTSVTMGAAAKGNSTFAGWTGCDWVSGSQCTVILTAAKTVTATFTDTTPPTVTVTPPGGGYLTPVDVSLIANEPATIYYTTNGSTPTTGSAVYSTPFPFSANGTLKYFGVDPVGNASAVKTETYTFGSDTIPPLTTASPAGGTYSAPIQVTLFANEPATIYYTTNGTTPTTASPSYTVPLAISSSATLKYFATDTAGNSSAVGSQLYTIDTVPPVTTPSPAGGTFANPVSVTLTANEAATIYYTTNGATPTTASPVYAGPVPILSTATLQFFARDLAGNMEAVKSQLYIIKQNQTINFPAPPPKTFGDPQFTITATASSNLPVTFASSNPAVATINGNTVTILTAGTTIITATQTGNELYNPAPAVQQTLRVEKAVATISFDALAFIYDGSPKPVTVTTTPAGLAVSITYDGSTTPPTNAGSYAIIATVNDPNWQGTATATEEIAKRSQTITFAPLPAKTFGDADVELTATASSNQAVYYTSSNTSVATLVSKGNKTYVHIVGAGTTIITACQDGNNNYSPATPVPQTLTVAKAPQTITFTMATGKTVGDPAFTLNASASSSLPVSYTSDTASVATINGKTVTIVGPGTTIITALQPGDSNYNAAAPVSFTLTVSSQSGTNYVACTWESTTNYYGTISQSLTAMTSDWSGTMKLQTRTYTENINLNVTGASVALTGGYDASFGSISGYATILGSLTVTTGALTVDRLVIM